MFHFVLKLSQVKNVELHVYRHFSCFSDQKGIQLQKSGPNIFRLFLVLIRRRFTQMNIMKHFICGNLYQYCSTHFPVIFVICFFFFHPSDTVLKDLSNFLILKSFASQIRSNIGCCINNLVSIYKNNAVGVTFEEFITSNFGWVVETIRREVFKKQFKFCNCSIYTTQKSIQKGYTCTTCINVFGEIKMGSSA